MISQPAVTNEVFVVGNTLKVTVVKASGLLAADPWGTSDPYCSVSFGPQRLVTNTVLKTLSPMWNQQLVFPIRATSPRQLTFALWDSDLHTDNDPLGQCSLDLSDLQLGIPMPATLPVVLRFTHGKAETKGQLWVSVVAEARPPTISHAPEDDGSQVAAEAGTLPVPGEDERPGPARPSASAVLGPDPAPLAGPRSPGPEALGTETAPRGDTSPSPASKQPRSDEPFSVGQRLRVTVLKAEGLLAADPWGTSDPYCSVSFGPQRLVTNTVLKTLSPVWNQQLVFPIRATSPRQLTFALWDSDLHTDNDPLGQCSLDLSDLQVGIPHAATLPVVLRFTHGKPETKGRLWVSALLEAR